MNSLLLAGAVFVTSMVAGCGSDGRSLIGQCVEVGFSFTDDQDIRSVECGPGVSVLLDVVQVGASCPPEATDHNDTLIVPPEGEPIPVARYCLTPYEPAPSN